LDTGGGVARALDRLCADGPGPFFVANSDILVLDGVAPVCVRLAGAWRERDMDALLLLHPTARAFGYDGRGDFAMAPDGALRRRGEREVAPFIFAGVQMLHPRLFEDTPEGPFSLNLLYDRAEKAGRLFGLRHDGEWLHVGTPQALREVEDHLKKIL
jgi:MurNAc alpha-1-phosphate uridylyltransferase